MWMPPLACGRIGARSWARRVLADPLGSRMIPDADRKTKELLAGLPEPLPDSAAQGTRDELVVGRNSFFHLSGTVALITADARMSRYGSRFGRSWRRHRGRRCGGRFHRSRRRRSWLCNNRRRSCRFRSSRRWSRGRSWDRCTTQMFRIRTQDHINLLCYL